MNFCNKVDFFILANFQVTDPDFYNYIFISKDDVSVT